MSSSINNNNLFEPITQYNVFPRHKRTFLSENASSKNDCIYILQTLQKIITIKKNTSILINYHLNKDKVINGVAG